MEKFAKFARLAEIEFSQIVISTQDLGLKLRVYLKDKSFIDLFLTTKLSTKRFSIHWERNHVDKTIYRIDNTPDKKWKKVVSFPIHFHEKKYDKVIKPPFKVKKSIIVEEIWRDFLRFAEKEINRILKK